ncbi:MAG: DUF2306 domain-containing protein [Anaerolineae bacterium]
MSDISISQPTTMSDTALTWGNRILTISVWVSSLLFGVYILAFYVAALFDGDLSVWNDAALPDLYEEGEPAATAGIALHFAMGALILILGSIQFIHRLRIAYPKIHRFFGKIYIGASFLTAIGGLTFIAVSGTIGGTVMNIGFALYGILMLVATVETVRHARNKNFDTHNEWSMRLYALAIGSWLYRMSYGFWFLMAGDLWLGENFTGPFDYFMDFAFYIPSLILVELIIRARKNGSSSMVKFTTIGAMFIAIALVGLGTYAFTNLLWGPVILAIIGL